MWFFNKKKNNVIDKKVQFSKVWLTIIMICSIIWISLSYVLAFLDRADIAQELSNDIVKVVIAALLGYFLKSFFETNAEERTKLKYKELELDINDDYDDEEELDP